MKLARMKLGCDPEIFLQDAAGAYVSSIGMIGGSKDHPRPLPLGKGYAVQEDNVAIEFNIPPAGSMEEFKDSINKVKAFLTEQIGEMGLKFSAASATLFPEAQLMDPAALVFGCDPDFDAWKDGAQNPKPKADDWTLRSCGGHVHVGHKFNTKKELIEFIKWMDLYLAVPSVHLDNGELRKQLYGKAGAFRYKPYGGEYRTLSNFWIFDDKLIDWVWKATDAAMGAWLHADATALEEDGQHIQDAINKNDKVLADMLIDKYNLMQHYA